MAVLINILCLYLSFVYAVNIGDLFHVKQGTTVGGCDAQLNELQGWIDDIQTLTETALSGIAANGATTGDKYSRRNLLNFFGVRFTQKLAPFKKDPGQPVLDDTIRMFLQDLQDYLDQNMANTKVEALQGDKKPWLFCNSDWLTETETVYDNDGDVVTEPEVDDGPPTVRNIPISDTDPNSLGMDVYQTPAGNTDANNWDNYAYWSPDILDYALIPKATRYLPNPNAGNRRDWCYGDVKGGPVGPGNWRFALTQKGMDAPSIMLCPIAFTGQSANWDTLAAMMADANSAAVGQLLDDQMTRAVTLMHEMFHLIEDPGNSPDAGTKAQECLELIALHNNWQGASTNPESYPFFALSYYLTTKRTGPPEEGGSDPVHYDWSKGISSVWQDSTAQPVDS